ncbi:MAG: response regulator [Armatimonadetes bacterium]|nr:response regulator [Armatimonadota bacterium]
MALKILVCDDERHIVRLIQVNLEKQGYQVVTAYDGKEGLEKIKAEKPNLVVLDVMMPYMDGFEVLKNLRREPDFMDLPVIMLTAKAQDKDVFEGYHYGADMYLTKPFNPIELVTFVKRIAEGAGGNNGGPKRYEV